MGSSYSVEVAAMNAMMGFIVMIVFVCLVGVAAQVLMGLATYNDAKARGNNDPVMWGLLVGFLGWIPGIVYLCLRNNNANRLMTCPQCGFVHRVAEPFCPQCRVQNPYSAPFQNPLTQQQAHRAKLLLIWAVVAYPQRSNASRAFCVSREISRSAAIQTRAWRPKRSSAISRRCRRCLRR